MHVPSVLQELYLSILPALFLYLFIIYIDTVSISLPTAHNTLSNYVKIPCNFVAKVYSLTIDTHSATTILLWYTRGYSNIYNVLTKLHSMLVSCVCIQTTHTVSVSSLEGKLLLHMLLGEWEEGGRESE